MKYEIIKNSESHTGYNIPDEEWIGEIKGLVNGWQYEYQNAKGEYNYSSVSYVDMMPEEYANLWQTEDGLGLEWIHDTARALGWEPTGRVVFRGYAVELYDPEERDYYVEPYDASVERGYMAR